MNIVNQWLLIKMCNKVNQNMYLLGLLSVIHIQIPNLF